MKKQLYKLMSFIICFVMLATLMPAGIMSGMATVEVSAAEAVNVNTLEGLKAALEKNGDYKIHLSGNGGTINTNDFYSSNGSYYIVAGTGYKTLVLESKFVVEVKNALTISGSAHKQFDGFIYISGSAHITVEGTGSLLGYAHESAAHLGDTTVGARNCIFALAEGGGLRINSGTIGGCVEKHDSSVSYFNYFGAINFAGFASVAVYGGRLVGTVSGRSRINATEGVYVKGSRGVISHTGAGEKPRAFNMHGGLISIHYIKN